MKPMRTSDSATTSIKRKSQFFAAMAFSEHCFIKPVLNLSDSLLLCLPPVCHSQSGFLAKDTEKQSYFVDDHEGEPKTRRFRKLEWHSVCFIYSFLPFFPYYLLCRGRVRKATRRCVASRDSYSIESLPSSLQMMKVQASEKWEMKSLLCLLLFLFLSFCRSTQTQALEKSVLLD